MRAFRKELAGIKRFHKMPNFEVLELLSEEGELCGFKVHFSNGNAAQYQRGKDGIIAENITFENDGSINFFVGDLGALENKWKVNNVEVLKWEDLNS
jgi:hypothetical protein